MRTWVNQSDQPPPSPPSAGSDPIIGQQERSGDRTRTFKLKDSDGLVVEIDAPTEWVIPTGEGYFFSPSINALRNVLAKPNS